MKCPSCQSELRMTDRAGIEIDYCPQCRGVWLDRGELDKIIERTLSQGEGEGTQERYPSQRPPSPGHHHNYPKSHKPYRKKSFLGELFDFD